MKEMAGRMIMSFIIFFSLIVFLFLFVDCKIENVQLKTKYEILDEKFTDLEKELTGTREVYSKTLIALIGNYKIPWDELSQQLPEYEYKYLQTIYLSQNDVNNE